MPAYRGHESPESLRYAEQPQLLITQAKNEAPVGEHDSAVPIVNLALKLNEEKRQFARFPVHAKGILLIDNRIIHCEVENVSLGGAYVSLDTPIEINTSVIFTIFGTATTGALSCVEAKVVRVTENGVALNFECNPGPGFPTLAVPCRWPT